MVCLPSAPPPIIFKPRSWDFKWPAAVGGVAI